MVGAVVPVVVVVVLDRDFLLLVEGSLEVGSPVEGDNPVGDSRLREGGSFEVGSPDTLPMEAVVVGNPVEGDSPVGDSLRVEDTHMEEDSSRMGEDILGEGNLVEDSHPMEVGSIVVGVVVVVPVAVAVVVGRPVVERVVIVVVEEVWLHHRPVLLAV